MPPVRMEVEFSLFPDNTVLGPSFTLSGFQFTDKGASPSFVNVSGGQKGLQFGSLGVRVKLPTETTLVTVRGDAFAGDFSIIGINGSGTPVVSETIPGDNAPHVVDIVHPRLAFLEFVGGGNEGLIDSIWYRLDCGGSTDARSKTDAGAVTVGIVRDLDFSSKETQVLIESDRYVVTDERVQRVLEFSMVTQSSVRVTAMGEQIESVAVLPTLLPACSGARCVRELTCAPECTAVIENYGEVTTSDPRALGILLTALEKGVPVDNLAVDAEHRITQVKVNIVPTRGVRNRK